MENINFHLQQPEQGSLKLLCRTFDLKEYSKLKVTCHNTDKEIKLKICPSVMYGVIGNRSYKYNCMQFQTVESKRVMFRSIMDGRKYSGLKALSNSLKCVYAASNPL